MLKVVAVRDESEGLAQVVDAEFVCSAFKPDQLPASQLSEIAFVGRSNVGKSSLLNTLSNRKGLAHTSKTPGRTQAINFFRVRCKLSGDLLQSDDPFMSLYFVDLPGYGYAKVPRSVKRSWGELLEGYLETRDMLHTVVLLVDSRRQIEDEEAWVLERRNQWNLIVAVTKADKVSKNELATKIAAIGKEYGVPKENILKTSVPPAKRSGVPQLLDKMLTDVLSRP